MSDYKESVNKDLDNVVKLIKEAPSKQGNISFDKKTISLKKLILPVSVILILISIVALYKVSYKCNIKANIDANGNRYYYMPYDPYYESVKVSEEGESFLCSEEEAIANGWKRKSLPKSARH